MTSAPRGDRLPTRTKLVYATGDHTVNVVLSAASLLYLVFLTDIVGLRPALAAGVVWIARAVDAFSDPTMGRISDLTRWKAGRRRREARRANPTRFLSVPVIFPLASKSLMSATRHVRTLAGQSFVPIRPSG